MAEQNIDRERDDVKDEATKDDELTAEAVADAEETGVSNSEESEMTTLSAALSKAQDDLKEAKDQVLRAYADVQNAQRRAQMDVEKAHKFALDKFVESLLPVVDSLERGLATDLSEESSSAMKEGIELTLKLFLDTLQKFNVEQVSPEGEPFDPACHQAMSQIDSPDSEPGSVINVYQKGYTLNGRLVRPAMVIVAK